MYHDDKVYDASMALTCAWNEKLREAVPRIISEVADAAGVEAEAEFVGKGAFNIVYKVRRFRAIYRFPIFGQSAFRLEKTNDECMIMQYLSRHTTIPVPRLIAVRNCEVGPYLVMACVDGKDLSGYLEGKRRIDERGAALNPNINLTTLAQAYRGMARILIELSKCRFTHIGAVGRDESNTRWCVTKRPITLNMNQIVSCGNYPVKALPQHAFATANEYFTSLAETHLTHLRTQINDAIDDEIDAQKKYVSRCLFLKIAKRFSTQDNTGPFPLYCDDFRPSNVLVDEEMDIRGVIDWEFCYAAPVELTYCSPWWLLLKHPDDWRDGDLSTFFEQYLPRHRFFIQILREEELALIHQGKLTESQCLSSRMSESVSNGHFWFCLAATSSYGFDDIYWRFIDPVYYGPFTSIQDRIEFLSQQERDDLAPFVQMKVQQAEKGKLDQHWTLEEMYNA
ncbi:hypothetical protein DV738_g1553, partial [Chaetothyriales sp. CBS 135597]